MVPEGQLSVILRKARYLAKPDGPVLSPQSRIPLQAQQRNTQSKQVYVRE